ncbi:type III secretion apparatus protein, YscD/HrpQ family [Chlamydia ibidis]|uniref:Type III secretion apparatus protein, YscD/HrpQ family n=2 Tax=Chlamydia ibidis TaxID=1405396 RepID=S7J2N3_9CHLA|nr:type III secretion system inner membrane ring subunit SctD [Chlamydia ibidis]EPP34503.1 type III secretion apparatus protein, YscD/HrpQ family [Chlamydia ibidis]EQM63049.1 hypothetical protein H359_0097 [Chlamydia ibidis 10-1398/6]
MGARLVIDKGPLSGVVLALEEGTSWSIGNDQNSCDIPLEDAKISSAQVVITKQGDEYFITNLHDANPVLVNGTTIKETTSLHPGDVIVFGSNQYSFLLDEFDPKDTVYDFAFSDEGVSGVPESSSQSPSQEKKKTSSSKRSREKESASNEGSKASLTDKDKKLAEAFLSSADKDSSDIPIAKDIPDNGTAKKSTSSSVSAEIKENQQATMEENGVPSNQNQQPSPDSVPQDIDKPDQAAANKDSQKQSENPSNSKPEDETKEGASSDEQVKQASEEGTQKQATLDPLVPQDQPNTDKSDDKQSEQSTQDQGQSQQTAEQTTSTESGDSEEASQKNTSEQEDSAQDETSKGDKTSETDLSDEHTADAQEEKSGVLTPFNVQDLFRFDQGIFPAEIDEIAQKNVSVDLSQPSRFLLKVLAGANIGAEFHLDTGRSYIIGSDANAVDIVFNDLSVSQQHAKITVGNDGSVTLEDLGSKNGIIVEGRKIEGSTSLKSNQVVALGTTLFLLIDHLAPAETIVASFPAEDYGLFGRPQSPEEIAQKAAEDEEEKKRRATLPTGAFIFTLFVGGLALLFGIGTASLFHTKEVVPIENFNFQEDIERVVNAFPTVRYTFNKTNGQLFLIGHVKNSIDKSELLYKVDALSFIKSVDDNVIDDEAVWQEMNILLSKRPEFKGISMHSPEPGQFVITGYLKTEDQAACLSDYLNLHFNYLSLLENKVVVESQMLKAIAGQLLQNGFANIHVAFVNGEVILTGYVNNDAAEKFRTVVQELSLIPGVRLVKNFVVLLPAEEGIIDLNLRYPNRYRVTGYSKYGDVSINVVVNGRILTRGDVIDGMTVTSIQPHCIFLEKEGLKYKIEYNK